jgi:hypothetical protein
MVAAACAFAQAPEREPVLLELRLGQAASLAMPAVREGTRLWLPIGDLLSAVELELTTRSATRVDATWWARRETFAIIADSGIVRRGLTPLKLLPGSVLAQPDGVLLDLDVIRQLLDTPLEVSWSDLVVAVSDIARLPLGTRLAREAARARFAARADSIDAASLPVAPLARPLARGGVLDYSLNVPVLERNLTPGWSAAVGLDVLGGSLEVSGGAVAGGTSLPTLASWSGVWRTGRKLTQLRLGDGLGGGPRPRLGRGLFLTNSPYMRPALFGLQTVRAELPPGWSLEAYRNGELVAVDTVGRDLNGVLSLPVLYGENPLDLLAIGPFGQTRALTQNLRVQGDVLPAGRSEYGISVAQCRLRQQCVASMTADLRVGLTDRWTMRMGLDGLARDSVAWRQAPYFAFTGAPVNGFGVQFDMAGQSHSRLAAQWDPSTALRLSAEQQWFGRDPLDPLLMARRRSQSSLYGLWRSFTASQAAVEGNVDLLQFAGGDGLLRARLAVSTQRVGVRWSPYVRVDQSSRFGALRQRVLGLENTVLPNPGRGRYVGSALMRTITEVDVRGQLYRQTVSAAMPLPRAFRLDAGVAWQRTQRGALLTLTLSRDLSSLRSYSTLVTGGSSATAVQTLQGSALFTHATRAPRFVPGPSLQRAGVRGVVYLDRNANGQRDPDEPRLADVRVQVGTGHAITRDNGEYAVWDLVPFVPLPITLDSSTLASPLWVAAPAYTQVEIGPNHLAVVDVPVLPGGVIDGRVMVPEGTAGAVAGVPLVLRDARGHVLARVRSFTDGEFTIMGVRPGTHRLDVDREWLQSQGVQVASVAVVVPPDENGAQVRVPPIVLVRAAPPAP